MVCRANQLTGFCIMGTLAVKRLKLYFLCSECRGLLPTVHDEEETYDTIDDTNGRNPPPVPVTARPDFLSTDSKLDCAICKCFWEFFFFKGCNIFKNNSFIKHLR